MCVRVLILTIVLLKVCSSIDGQTNVWKGIAPLRSTKADVEKLLGKPIPPNKALDVARYKIDEGRVDVIYSTGLCGRKTSAIWNVPVLTVLKVTFYPTVPLKLSDLKLDLTKFAKHPDPGAAYTTIYANDNDGISLSIDDLGEVATILNYYPTSKDGSLRCKKINSRRKKT